MFGLAFLMLLLLPAKVEYKHHFASKASITQLRAELIYAKNWLEWMPAWQETDAAGSFSKEGADGIDGFVLRSGDLHWRLVESSGSDRITYRRRDAEIAKQVIHGSLEFQDEGDSTEVIWTEWVQVPFVERWKSFSLRRTLMQGLKASSQNLLIHLSSDSLNEAVNIRFALHNGSRFVQADQISFQRALDSDYLSKVGLQLEAWASARGERAVQPLIWLCARKDSQIQINELALSVEKRNVLGVNRVLDSLLCSDSLCIINTPGRLEMHFKKLPKKAELTHESIDVWMAQNQMIEIEPYFLIKEKKQWRYVIPYKVDPALLNSP